MTSAHTPSSRDWQARLYEHPLVWLVLLTMAHVVSRVAISPGVKWDESEQILWAQQFALGYGPQPPLYTWMQWAVCQLLGPSVLALALVKQVLIALSYVLAWHAARTLLDPPGAWHVAGALVLMLPFGWHALRDQTHSVLVTAMGFGAWSAVLRQIRAPQPGNFLWLGLFCGLGLLTKYNFALFIAALLLAALTVPQARRAVLAPGWWWAPLVGLLIFAPHGYWLLSHWHQATAETLQKMDISAQRTWLQGLGSLALAVLSTLGLWLLVLLLSYRRRLWRANPGRPPTSPPGHSTPAWRAWAWPLLGRYLLIVCLALLGMVLAGGVSHFKQRWVLPLLSITPLALYVWRPVLLEPAAGRGYTTAVVGVALFFLVLATARPWIAGWRGDADELNHPVPQLAELLTRAGYDGRGVIVGSDHMIAAMLHSRFPQGFALACAGPDPSQADCIRSAHARAHAAGVGLLLVARRDRAPASWWNGVFAVLPAAPVHALDLPLDKMPRNTPPMRYEYVWLPAPIAP